ncbi:MAG: cytidine deaminase [Candidatus Komeilibacteria bacterium CG11_big_fil_rev_8_21_14_0_20_36_20]|uniref:Cytidine deaminase n=1 Tax=Candidatus Komeilibacteria bacterium CG11_big_fil_rev_8_21_14_0_20_36_20 TaxID=1974477 RepID=A0A2H0NAV6_9BACT|nr:MAG: cytidine deaminase [Candidatus Komeilibacteria bacterium CG11_big_fil_rev_8_21_14_0_20_36_20]PIR82033.1 MAG: cytidine deaminase [Candidatus Komeilibacteria bacterium CG10_big_fil_rev_8_21_14_0_10_36_65]PJC55012.1 MAG: cytidine deaminase [Candidatus Komeilibacteria bacterium CG_4_9_14_0_2_um_filter_36_13]
MTKAGKTGPRENYLSWDDTFILMADLIAQRSKDPSTQTGAVVVDENNIILGLGYNGWPRGVDEGLFPWDREGGYEKEEFLNTKYAYVVHAELNAILNANKSVRGGKVYCHLFPCNDCAKVIIQAGIKELIYQEDKYIDVDIFQASRKLFEAAGVKLRQYTPTKKLKIE